MAGLLNESWGHRGRGSPHRGEGASAARDTVRTREKGLGREEKCPGFSPRPSWSIISVFHWLKPERIVELERKRGTSLKITWSLDVLMPYMPEAS